MTEINKDDEIKPIVAPMEIEPFELRSVKRLRNGFIWEEIEFKDLQEGDIFKLFESTGEPVKDSEGKTEFVADSDAFLNENDVWSINIM